MYLFPFEGRNRISSSFGIRTLNGKTDFHKGLDIVGVDDKRVHAVIGGYVKSSTIITNHNDLTWQWGNYIKIHGDDGLDWFYCHLATRYVKIGDRIEAGDIIGLMGNTGYSFGEHTHLEVRNGKKESLNPCVYLGIPNISSVEYDTALIASSIIITLTCVHGSYRWRTGVGVDKPLYYDRNAVVFHCMEDVIYRVYDIRADDTGMLWCQITPPNSCTIGNVEELWVSSECFDMPITIPPEDPEPTDPPSDGPENPEPKPVDWDSSCNEFVVSATGNDRKRLRSLCEELSLPVKNLTE